jgi:hypothetical protein
VLVHDGAGIPVGDAVLIAKPADSVVESQKARTGF